MNEELQRIVPRTAVVIPAYNAARHLETVVDDTARFVPRSQIVVVDDGSSDDTYHCASRAGVVVEQHQENRGKGAALATGMTKATEMGMDFIVTLDADGQHNPEDIPRFLKHEIETNADIIIGNRMAERQNMPAIRVFANRATSWFVTLRTGVPVPDSQNGYRLFRVEMFKKLAPRLKAVKYDAESEILIKAAKAGAKIESISVETIYGTEKSSVNPVIDTLRFLRMAFKSLFW
ncbi:MAG: glycosyltransferase family 2 protein [Candidatus Latescibacterota bacterium]|nr:MAG: glycosyltransferase family 2 protein [Candidatus Latescibacterota bacterium]